MAIERLFSFETLDKLVDKINRNFGVGGIATLKTYFDTLYPAKIVPYKFHVWRNAAANTGNAAFAVVAFDTEVFDTGNNVSAGVFTAPIDGYYQFNAAINCITTTTLVTSLFINGTEYSRGNQFASGSQSVGALIKLTANDTVDVRVYGNAATALSVGSTPLCYFTGFLVST